MADYAGGYGNIDVINYFMQDHKDIVERSILRHGRLDIARIHKWPDLLPRYYFYSVGLSGNSDFIKYITMMLSGQVIPYTRVFEGVCKSGKMSVVFEYAEYLSVDVALQRACGELNKDQYILLIEYYGTRIDALPDTSKEALQRYKSTYGID